MTDKQISKDNNRKRIIVRCFMQIYQIVCSPLGMFCW